MQATASALTPLYTSPVWDLGGGPFVSPAITVPVAAHQLSCHVLPVVPNLGPLIQLRDGYFMSVSVEKLVIGASFQVSWHFLIGTEWSSYGQKGLTGVAAGGTRIPNPGALLNFPSPGGRIRVVVESQDDFSIEVLVSWL